jgi:hypothetical protein
MSMLINSHDVARPVAPSNTPTIGQLEKAGCTPEMHQPSFITAVLEATDDLC